MSLKQKVIIPSVLSACLFSGFVNAETPLYVGVGLGGDFHSEHTGSSTNNVLGLVNVGYQENKYLSGQISGMLARYNMGYILAEGLFTVPANQFITPYLEFGLGYTHLNGNGAGFNAGVGLKVNLSDQLSLSVDYRYVQQFSQNTPATNVLSGGISWYFDRNDSVLVIDPNPKPVKFVEAN